MFDLKNSSIRLPQAVDKPTTTRSELSQPFYHLFGDYDPILFIRWKSSVEIPL